MGRRRHPCDRACCAPRSRRRHHRARGMTAARCSSTPPGSAAVRVVAAYSLRAAGVPVSFP
jgi:hypothetical protein